MLSVPFEIAEIFPASNYGCRSDVATDDLAAVFHPVRIGVDLSRLADGIRLAHEQAEFTRQRPGIASLLLLAHEIGVLSESDIDACVAEGWQSVYRCFQSAVAKIMGHLNDMARHIAGTSSDHNAFERLYCGLEQSLPDNTFCLCLTLHPRFSQLPLTDLDPELGQTVVGCLHWLTQELGVWMTTDDLKCYSPFIDDELYELNVCLEKNPELDNRTLAEWFLETETYPFCEYTNEAEYLSERLAFLRSMLNATPASCFGDPPDIGEVRRRVVHWRRSNPSCYRNPWRRFVRACVTVWKWHTRNIPLNSENPLIFSWEGDYTDVPLNHGHVIGYGFTWEELLVDQFYNDIGQAGEYPMGWLPLEPSTLEQTAFKLTLLAKTRGLLRLAELISMGEHHETP